MASLEEFLKELWDTSPLVHEERAKSWVEGFAEAFAESFPKAFPEGFAETFPESFSKVFAKSFSKAFAESFFKASAKSFPNAFPESLELPRSLVETAVNVRFPALTNLAHQKLTTITHPEALRTLMAQIVAAPDEQTVRELLLSQQPS